MAVGDKTLSGQTSIILALNNYKELDFNKLQDSLNITRGENWTSGTGANQVQILFHDIRTLADGANEVLDLYESGTLKDQHGDLLTLTALKFLYIKNKSADATLQLFGGTTPVGICADATDIVKVKPGGTFVWIDPSAAGLDVTTNKNLKIEHDGTGSSSMDVEIALMGLD